MRGYPEFPIIFVEGFMFSIYTFVFADHRHMAPRPKELQEWNFCENKTSGQKKKWIKLIGFSAGSKNMQFKLIIDSVDSLSVFVAVCGGASNC